MMCDFDALYRQYGKLIASHLYISNILHDCDKRHQPQVYQFDDFIFSRKWKWILEDITI